MARVYLTTGEAAKMLGVSSKMVSKWCDSGDLPAHRLPHAGVKAGRQHRRIRAKDLLDFANRHKLPIVDRRPVILLAGFLADGELCGLLAGRFGEDWLVSAEAGAMESVRHLDRVATQGRVCDLLIVSASGLGNSAAADQVVALSYTSSKPRHILAILPKECQGVFVEPVDEVFHEPVEAADVVAWAVNILDPLSTRASCSPGDGE